VCLLACSLYTGSYWKRGAFGNKLACIPPFPFAVFERGVCVCVCACVSASPTGSDELAEGRFGKRGKASEKNNQLFRKKSINNATG
jgi:hypothetical protein